MQTLEKTPASTARIETALATSQLFQPQDTDLVRQVAKRGTLMKAGPGTAIVTQGESADAFFLLLEGIASVMVQASGSGESVEVRRMEAPQSIGEMGLILNDPRSASVIAHTDVLLARFERKLFTAMFKQVQGFGLGICQALARRLQHANRQVPLESHEEPPPPELIGMLPMAFIQRHRVLPMAVDGNSLKMGFVDDVKPVILGRLREMLPGMTVTPVGIRPSTFDDALRATGAVETADRTGPAAPSSDSPRLDRLLERMVAEGASDLHLSAGERPRWRLDGEMVMLSDMSPLGRTEVLELCRPILPPRSVAEFDETSDTDFAYAIAGTARFRGNVFWDHHGVGAVFRQIPAKILTIDQLGLPPVVRKLCDQPKGLVLVTGPTGSGKSTTLAGMIDHINRSRATHIITLEDPIEFVHQSQKSLVNQREIGAHTTSFARALKAALRQDPDIVLIGELRDLETVSMALELANTGHLVFATLHTSTAITTVDRIVDLFPHEQQSQVRTGMSESLRGVVSQTLCRRRGGGRVAAVEVLVVNTAVANLVREGKTAQIINVMQTGRSLGNQSLNAELTRLVKNGTVEFEEAMKRAVDKKDLARRCGRPMA